MNTRPADTKLIGSMLHDRFKITELFSSGGMSVLYKGVDTLDGGVVAIRMMHAHRTGEHDAVKRFEHGLKAIALLDHSNIVPALTSGVSADGRPFIVAPFIQGISLREQIAKHGRLTVEQSVPIIQQVCAAIEHAHEQGIVHRNIKPGNILLCDRGGKRHAYLTGFGIAKQVQGSYEALGVLTQTNKIIGSPRYMSPEQFTTKQTDARSDIYSFGCVCYEMLTGAPPFTVPSPLAMMSKHLLEYPPKIAAAMPDFPAYLDNIVAAAILKKPEDRYQSANALLKDLNDNTCSINVDELRKVALSGARTAGPETSMKVLQIVMFGLLIVFVLSIAVNGLWFVPKQPTDYLGRPI